MVKLYAVISKTSPRYQDWLFILGSDHAPVQSGNPIAGSAPGCPPTLFYKLDLSRITLEQRRRLVKHISARWDVDPAQVESDLDSPHGMPILADDVTIVVDQRMEV